MSLLSSGVLLNVDVSNVVLQWDRRLYDGRAKCVAVLERGQAQMNGPRLEPPRGI